MSAPESYLIIKRGLYYRPSASGYTGLKDDAGRYSLEEVAVHFPNLDSPNQDGMSFVNEMDAPDYSPACPWDTRLVHRTRQEERSHAAALVAQAEKPLRERLAELENQNDSLRHSVETLEARCPTLIAQARAEALEEAMADARSWQDIGSILSMAKIMTASEVRAARAVAEKIEAAIRARKDTQ